MALQVLCPEFTCEDLVTRWPLVTHVLTLNPAVGLALLPESPRYWVKRGNLDRAAHCLSRLRGQPEKSDFIEQELAEIVANHEYELKAVGLNTSYIRSWLNCFSGSIRDPASNLRRTLIGVSAQMFQQFTGINFIFYFGTVFFQSLG